MYSAGVFIQVEHSKLGIAKGSGVRVNNIIITHGSILASMCFSDDDDDILERYNIIIRDLQRTKYNTDSCEELVKFKVLRNQHEQHPVDLSLCTSCSRPSENVILDDAQLFMLHSYTGMTDIATEISNWSNSNNSSDEDVNRLSFLLLPKIIFLLVGVSSEELFSKSLHAVLNTLKDTILSPGLQLVIESTPFCNYSFFNSWSRGIISKIIGPVNGGILTDARLVTGCEGAPIYTFEKGAKGKLIGMVIQTISWCNGEWIGFSLGLSMKHLLRDVLGLQATRDYIPFNKMIQHLPSSLLYLDKLAASVVFVRCRHKWGSGVVINEEQGLILTCSHVVHHDLNAVSVLHEGDRLPASVIYASPQTTPYDLALLSVGKVPKLRQLKLADTSPILGETVVAAGYPLSTESLVIRDDTPTLSMGCVSKVSSRGGPLQTTCCTQSGLSGGALLRPPDQLLGIIVSNIRLDSATMPSFSFAISVDDLKGPITKYLATKDPLYLQSLCQGSCALKMEWSLIDCKL